MIIKKYMAKTEKEAIELAKKELGEHIVIMNVKNTKKKGILGLLGQRVVEVTVALEAETDKAIKEFDRLALISEDVIRHLVINLDK